MSSPVRICCCHSDSLEDIRLWRKLEKHLSLLVSTHQITLWHPGKLQPGDISELETTVQIAKADLILILLSPDFFFSQTCCEQLGFALIQFHQRQASILPILLRPFAPLDLSPLAHLAPLPQSKKPVTNWSNKDSAFAEIVQSIQSKIATLRSSSHAKVPSSQEDFTLSKYVFIPGMRGKHNVISQEALKSIWNSLPTSGLCIHGKYRLREFASTLGETVRSYVPLCIPGFTPVSVSIDTSDCGPRCITKLHAMNLSSGGVEICGIAAEANSLCEAAGNITIQY